MRRACQCLLPGVALFFVLVPLAWSEQRFALVIGNDKYQQLAPLKKAVGDAGSFARALRAKGFNEVIFRTDLDRGGIDQAVAAFVGRLHPGDLAFFMFAGHGWSDGDENYILGVDVPSQVEEDYLKRISVPLKNGVNGIIDAVSQKGVSLQIAVIDACRDNPFRLASVGRSIGMDRGLARMGQPPQGTFIILSAGAGQTALDRVDDADRDPNSVFTRVFLPLMQRQRTLQEAIKGAQVQVQRIAQTAHHQQVPAYYDEVIGDACLTVSCDPPPAQVPVPMADPPKLAPPPPTAAPPVAASTVPGAKPGHSAVTVDQRLYNQAFDALRTGSYSVAQISFRDFVTNYPASPLAPSAQYWLGRSYQMTSANVQAAAAFKKVLDQWPADRRTPDAMLELAVALIDSKKVAEGRAYLVQVTLKYPGTDAAHQAADRLGIPKGR